MALAVVESVDVRHVDGCRGLSGLGRRCFPVHVNGQDCEASSEYDLVVNTCYGGYPIQYVPRMAECTGVSFDFSDRYDKAWVTTSFRTSTWLSSRAPRCTLKNPARSSTRHGRPAHGTSWSRSGRTELSTPSARLCCVSRPSQLGWSTRWGHLTPSPPGSPSACSPGTKANHALASAAEAAAGACGARGAFGHAARLADSESRHVLEGELA
jgi:hypothetical protein